MSYIVVDVTTRLIQTRKQQMCVNKGRLSADSVRLRRNRFKTKQWTRARVCVL